MTVKQLVEKLKQFPEDMPVATFTAINPKDVDDPDYITLTVRTWTHDNYPYDKSSFEYLDLL